MQTSPYGSWKSPVTADLIVAGSVGLGDIAVDGEDIYWVEGRPAEGGRSVIVRRAADGATRDVTPAPFNARTRVHEYGGGAFAVDAGTVFFSNFADQRIYRVGPGGEPRALTPEGPLRYADAALDRRRGRLVCVIEDHSGGEPVNSIAAVDMKSGEVTVLVQGADFYAAPRLSPEGGRLAWLCWNYPEMPWDGCELWTAELGADGRPANLLRAAGGRGESVFQPEWSPAGELFFVSDRTGWWNLYRLAEEGAQALCPMEAEFGLPMWVFGMSTYAFASAGEIVCALNERGLWRLARLDLAGGGLSPIETDCVAVGGLRAGPGFVAFHGAAADRPGEHLRLDLATGRTEVLRRSSDIEVDPGFVSVAEPIEFPTEGGRSAHAFFYPPKNRDFAASEGERPPLLVKSHGGPTSATTGAFSLGTQYWTSRGFAVLDVNYGGSTGYGREYRQRLDGAWGVVDVDDCAAGARYLAGQGRVDGGRLAIRGGSAGGYTRWPRSPSGTCSRRAPATTG